MSLAKLTPPSATRLVPRERLFARLDAARAHQLMWIAAPAGAGKTSLATSWIDARGLRPLWYRVDADDADPATFFHYLARFAAPSRGDLSALAPESLPGLAIFTRRFCRLLFESLPADFVLVLDNYQEIRADSPLHALVAILAGELPPGAALLAASRLGPPPPLARAFAGGTVLDWESLRFTLDETAQLLAAQDGGDAGAIQAATRDWAANIVLTTHAAGERDGSIDTQTTPQAVFDFIASEFFDRLPAGVRDFLLRVGILPVVTESLCTAITGDARGMQWLAELEGERLFVTLQPQTELAYAFHPLFHAFLRRRIDRQPEASARAHLVALALEQAGGLHQAAEVWAWAGAWHELVRLLNTHAPALLASGQFAVVMAWIRRLPAAMREASPYLSFWSAACRLMLDPAAARADFAGAYALFQEADDLAGQWLCWAGIAETFVFDWDSLAGFDPWIEELESLRRRRGGALSPEIEARALAGGVALMFRRPDHPLLQVWAERALTLIRSRQAVPHTANLALFAGCYHTWRGHTQALDAVLQAARTTDAPMSPLGRILLGLLELVLANFRGDAAGVEAALAATLAISTEHGVHVMDVPVIQNACLAALARGDADRLETLIHMAQPRLVPGRWLERALQTYLEAGLALLRGDLARAREGVDNTNLLIGGQGMPLLEIHSRLFLAHLDIREGRVATARAALEALLRQARTARCDLYTAAILLTRARLGLDAIAAGVEGREDKAALAETLREGLALGARWGYGHLFLYADPEAEGRLCAFALEADIEACYVRRLIQTRNLPPPADAGECWPWPVRVFTLGGFRLACAGATVRQADKPQKRPLELLKALAAQGPGGARGLALAALLWPDAEGNRLKKALDITLHRLRKLLGRDDAVLLRDGHLALNPQVCRIDLWAFEQAADRAIDALHAMQADTQAMAHEASRALRLYTGTFLATDEESGWLLPARDRALSRYQRLVADLGRQHEACGRWDAAAALYRRALEQDNLNEFLYRRLILCLQRQGLHAEALVCYRRCRELFSIVLGMAPAAETEALMRASREDQSANR